MINCVIHACQTSFSGANQIFVSNNLVDNLLLRKFSQFVLGIDVFVLPSVELSSTGVSHEVDYKSSFLLEFFSALEPDFPLLESSRHDLELALGKEHSNDSLLHVLLLGRCLLVQIVFDLFRSVS